MAKKSIVAKYTLSTNSAFVLNPATSNETKVSGLQSMGLLLGFTRDTLEVIEMGQSVATEVPASGKFEPASVEYNFAAGSVSLDTLRNASLNAILLQALRLYVKYGCDFSAPDLISDPTSGMYIGTVGDPKTDAPNSIWKGTLDYMAGGVFSLFIVHTGTDGTILSYAALTRTLTRSSGSFLTDGFEVGDTTIIDYADGNDPLYLKVETVTATDIVFVDAVGDVATLSVDFTGIAATQLHGATPTVISGVSSAC